MENITALKSGRRLAKQFASAASDITWYQVVAWLMCAAFSRAGFFTVIKPFSAAFYVAMGFTGASKGFAILSIALGSAVFSNFTEAARQTLALMLFEACSQFIFKLGNKTETAFSRSVLITVLIFLTGLIKGFIQGIHLYDLVVSIFSALLVFSLAVVMAPAGALFQASGRNLPSDGKKLLAKATLVCAAIISLHGVVVWKCDLGSVLASLAVLILARRKGSSFGACAGALFGMITALYSLPASLNIPGMLALAGAAAGLPVKSRTVGVALWTGVIISFAGLSVLEGSLVLNYYEALAAGILFYLIPSSLLNKISEKRAGRRSPEETAAGDSGLIREAADRLFIVGKALSRVSRSMEETVLDAGGEERPAAQWMVETVAERVCNRCSLCERCWGTHFLKTYKLVEKSISDLKTDESGQIEIPGWFKNTCTKPDKFFENLTTAYSLYKAENVWRIRLDESRMLLAKQAAIVSGSIMTIARGLLDIPVRDSDAEMRLLAAAGESGIPVEDFRCYCSEESKPFLEVVYEAKNKIRLKELDSLVKEMVHNSLTRVGENRRNITGSSVIRYMKHPGFKTATGVARIPRDSNSVSGDNVTFFISGEARHVCAISDGTGTGRKAEYYSRTAIQMLENLMEEGMELSLAIRFLNLYLDLKGESERLATLDVCSIDLFSGNADFYKYGSPASFIKGRDGVSLVEAEGKDPQNSAPNHFRSSALTAGSFVVMISDGILEAFSEKGEETGLSAFIEKLDTANAQQLADSILQEAVRRLKDSHDDMTVLVTKLW